MKGFIFGFQRFVWCPKWTPASNNSGTNSVVSAIREIPEGGSFQSGSVKMLQHRRVRNLKLAAGRLVNFGGELQTTTGDVRLTRRLLTGASRVFLRVSGQNPAEIRKTV